MPPRHHVVFRSLFWAVSGLIVLALLALPRRRAATILASAVVAVALVGSYAYVQNLARTGSVRGRAVVFSTLSPSVTATGTISTFARTIWGGSFAMPLRSSR